ncbi:MAG: hypothetical protein AAF611_04255 [Bacteroidota bacterium]
MKKQRKLNLRKLSIAKLDVTLIKAAIKGGFSENCNTEVVNCDPTSTKTRPEFTDPNGPNVCKTTNDTKDFPCI